MSTVCLGCSKLFDGNTCLDCEAKAVRLIQSSHWPLETSISPAALAELEIVLQHHVATGMQTGRVRSELANLANVIRSHLQHSNQTALPSRSEEESWFDD